MGVLNVTPDSFSDGGRWSEPAAAIAHGRRLIAEAVARHPGAEVIRLVVEADNEKGLSFYRREGFLPVGEHIEQGIRHVRMEKRLKPAE